jgi:hypothetical protein
MEIAMDLGAQTAAKGKNGQKNGKKENGGKDAREAYYDKSRM